METDDLIKLPASSNSEHGSEADDPRESGSEAIKSGSLPVNSKVVDEFDGSEMTDSVLVEEKMTPLSSIHAENGTLSIQNETSISCLKKEESILSKRAMDDSSSLPGAKRQRLTLDEQQPSVHVIYSSLPRESKQKLEGLLQQWSRWHSQRCSSSDDSNVVLESGEKTYFPALRVGLDNSSEVTFWVDDQAKIQSTKEFIPLDGTSVPLYDRGYSLALTSATATLDGGVEKLDTSRCFNCSSYSHAMKDCPKPRNNIAVNNARKEHNSNRSKHPNSRNSTRYYQSSRGGKYDGLKPGVLDAETRQLLGLGELDPPPWLNRMREIGYPPGYLDPDLEDQPSGITIFGDDESTVKAENEEGEILDGSFTEPTRKMTVEFPGINAPIPENADKWLWAAPSSANSSRYRSSQSRYNHQSSENLGRGRYSNNTEQRWSRDLEEEAPPPPPISRWQYSNSLEDEGPPGCEPGTSPSLSNHIRRYGEHDSSYYSRSPRVDPSIPWSPTYARSLSDRSRRSPSRYGQYGNLPYSSPR
ncbi:hypothetical protein ABFS82_08G040000 [Erythranthe guttata]|uniref:zinc finger CCHC domain-containing protein 8-like n=1 Tax=Erythranthe guttata TaxID=4155 RepID=UPI00064DF0D3|nr:PREDICTED: zinc finger CCHC domain-containing protein 8-like [Erythranthe guttata]|eukprot:XP_012852462.1 PREDICTED: zinc finger CCHC domain-containing protein 8-like [Erythranthe guttata]